MAFYPDERIALFIDGSNLYSTAKSSYLAVTAISEPPSEPFKTKAFA